MVCPDAIFSIAYKYQPKPVAVKNPNDYDPVSVVLPNKLFSRASLAALVK
jgi:hypothetical protein